MGYSGIRLGEVKDTSCFEYVFWKIRKFDMFEDMFDLCKSYMDNWITVNNIILHTSTERWISYTKPRVVMI